MITLSPLAITARSFKPAYPLGTKPLRFGQSDNLSPEENDTVALLQPDKPKKADVPLASGARTEANSLDLYLTEITNVQRLEAESMAQKAELVQAGRLAAEILEPDSPEKRERLNKYIIGGQNAAKALQTLSATTDRKTVNQLTKAVHQGKVAQTVLEKTQAPLTDEAVAVYTRQRQAGLKARNEMVEANTPLVVHIAKGYKQQAHMQGLGLDEVIAMGNEGLIRAVEKFNPQMIKASFSSHATWWIKEKIIRGLAQSDLVPLPEHENRNKAPEDKTPFHQFMSLNVPVAEDHDTAWVDTLPDERPGPDEVYGNNRAQQMILDAIKALTDKQQNIILRRYELVGRETEPPTLTTLGQELGITHQAVQLQQQKALKILKQNPVLQQLWEDSEV